MFDWKMLKWWVGVIIVLSGNMVNYLQSQQTVEEIDISFVMDYFTDDSNSTSHCDHGCHVGKWLHEIIQHVFQQQNIDVRVGVLVCDNNGPRHYRDMDEQNPPSATSLDHLNYIRLDYLSDQEVTASMWFNIFRNMTAASSENRPAARDIMVWMCEYTQQNMLSMWMGLPNAPHVILGRITYEAHDDSCTALSISNPNPTQTSSRHIIATIILQNCTGARCPTTTTTGTGTTMESTTPPTGTMTTPPTMSNESTTETSTETTSETPTSSTETGTETGTTRNATTTPTEAGPLLELWEIAVIALGALALLTVAIGLLACCLCKRQGNGPKGGMHKHSHHHHQLVAWFAQSHTPTVPRTRQHQWIATTRWRIISLPLHFQATHVGKGTATIGLWSQSQGTSPVQHVFNEVKMRWSTRC